MRRPHNKNLFVAITTAALAVSLTACSGAGPNAATRLIKQVTDGAEINIDKNESKISVTNLLLVATEDGSAVVVGTIINRGTTKDSLVGISVGNVPAALTGEVKLALNEPLRFEGEQQGDEYDDGVCTAAYQLTERPRTWQAYRAHCGGRGPHLWHG